VRLDSVCRISILHPPFPLIYRQRLCLHPPLAVSNCKFWQPFFLRAQLRSPCGAKTPSPLSYTTLTSPPWRRNSRSASSGIRATASLRIHPRHQPVGIFPLEVFVQEPADPAGDFGHVGPLPSSSSSTNSLSGKRPAPLRRSTRYSGQPAHLRLRNKESLPLPGLIGRLDLMPGAPASDETLSQEQQSPRQCNSPSPRGGSGLNLPLVSIRQA
jgi:hypothetical protein